MEASNDEKLQKEIQEMYMPLSVAKKEIWRRWNDKKLRKKVENFLGGDLPDFFKNSKNPKAIFCRDIISPITELFYFLDLASCADIKPALIEYTESKFVAKNSNKYHLCRLFFNNGFGKKGESIVNTERIIDFNTFEGKKLKNIKTLWGENLIDFHHKILKESVPELDMKDIYDFSDWFNKHREVSEYYYLHYLALFLAHGILFENLIFNKEEKEFTENKIIPSFNKLVEIFGIKPIIVPLAPREDENELYWWCYPKKIKKIFDEISNSHTLKIEATKKYGIGVFAKKNIKKGKKIWILDGEIISEDECIKRIKRGVECNDDPFQIEKKKYIDLDYLSHAFNHSCNPNGGIRKRSELFALRDIKKGEEITYDYSSVVGPNIPPSDWSMKCICGEKDCRGVLGNITTIPEDRLKEYAKYSAIPDFIKKEFKNLLLK